MEKENMHAAKYVIRKGLATPALRDEIYCQLMRMAIKNPRAYCPPPQMSFFEETDFPKKQTGRIWRVYGR